MADERDEMLRLERICLEQAELCETPEGRDALRWLAAAYRQAMIDQAKPAK
jgi:hypothetical protein